MFGDLTNAGTALFPIMKSFLDYLSFWKIANVVINKRVALADKRHREHQLHLMSPDLPLKALDPVEAQLLAMMPPRKSWVSLSKKSRYKPCSDGIHRQKKSTADVIRQSIKWTICNDLHADAEPQYLQNLNAFVAEVQRRVQDKKFKFSAPRVFPIIKDEKSCRPLCAFTDLYDSVIVILANRYLSELFNGMFYEESLAFRSEREYHGVKCVTSHHDAIARIKEYRRQHEGRNVYVAECDLKKFYDTVSHCVVRKCYYGLLRQVAKANPNVGFAEINRVFEAYLKCYTYPRNVYSLTQTEAFWVDNNIKEKCRCIKWVDKELKASGRVKSDQEMMQLKVGVPQGGALSGLIANMVLNPVDFQVAGRLTANDLYLRYCDDMIILSTNHRRCHTLFNTYYHGTSKLGLYPHKAKKSLPFCKKEFWDGKSKQAYLWAMKRPDAAEWIGFVGYEIRRDGWIRIRKRSFDNEIKKQREVVFNKTLNKLKNKDRVSNKSVLSTLRQKLVSMSVGKVAVWNYQYMDCEMCWAYGFRELEMNPVLSRQLHTLDRHRNMMLCRAKKRLKKMNKKEDDVMIEIVERADSRQLSDSSSDYLGLPHSYYYQFNKQVTPKHRKCH